MSIIKFGTIVEIGDDVHLIGFSIDGEGREISGKVALLTDVIERLQHELDIIIDNETN